MTVPGLTTDGNCDLLRLAHHRDCPESRGEERRRSNAVDSPLVNLGVPQRSYVGPQRICGNVAEEFAEELGLSEEHRGEPRKRLPEVRRRADRLCDLHESLDETGPGLIGFNSCTEIA